MKTQSTKERLAIDKGIHRNTLIEMGLYNVYGQKAYKDKSKYTRKEKHKKGFGEE